MKNHMINNHGVSKEIARELGRKVSPGDAGKIVAFGVFGTIVYCGFKVLIRSMGK